MDKQTGTGKIKLSIGSKGPRKSEEKQPPVEHEWQKGVKEVATAAEHPEKKEEKEEFEWLLPNQAEQSQGEGQAKVLYVPSTEKKKKNWNQGSNIGGKKLANIMLIVASAMVIGVLFGLGMVQVVTKKESAEPVTGVLQEEPPAATQETPQKTDTPAAEQPPAVTATASLPEYTTAIIQGGVFNTEESARKTQEILENQGVPTVRINHDNQYLLIAGLSQNVETGKAAAAYYKAQGADVFAKTLTISSKQVTTSKEDQAVIEKMLAILPIISEASAKSLEGQSIDKQQLAAEENKVKGLNPEQSEVKMMQTYLLQGFEKIQADSPQAGKETQAQLIAFLQAYTNLK